MAIGWGCGVGKTTRLLLMVGGAVLLACNGGPPKAVCEARVDALSRRLNSYRAAPNRVQLHAAKLPKLHGRPRAAAPYRVLEVAPAGNWMVVRLSDDVSRVAAQLGAWAESTAPSAPADGIPFYLGADSRTPVSEIAALFARLGHARVRVFLLGTLDTGPLGPPPPSAKALAEELDRAASPGELARIASNELSVRAGSCKPLAKELVRLNDLLGEAREAFAVKAIDEGLRACQCSSVDIDALEYLVMRTLGAPTNDFGMIPLPSDEKGHPVVPTEPGLTVEQWVQRL